MSLDNLLSQPLAPVPDQGFSARIVLELRRREERRRLLLWGAAAAALLPLALVLPLAPASMDAAKMLTQLAASHAAAYTTGALVLLWALRPARSRHF
jgi:hypothetical protein